MHICSVDDQIDSDCSDFKTEADMTDEIEFGDGVSTILSKCQPKTKINEHQTDQATQNADSYAKPPETEDNSIDVEPSYSEVFNVLKEIKQSLDDRSKLLITEPPDDLQYYLKT